MANIAFTNSKVALAFAALTILGTLSMVGTSDNEGVLGQIASRFSGDRLADNDTNISISEEQSAKIVPSKPAPAWGSVETAAAGPYVPPERSEVGTQKPPLSPVPPPQGGNPALAPLSPRAVVASTNDTSYNE